MYVAYAQAYFYIFICKLKNPFFHDVAHALFSLPNSSNPNKYDITRNKLKIGNMS